jgi:DNA gyrase subunit A
MLITAKGIIMRTGLEQIRAIGRNTQGVKIMKLDESDKIVAVERIAFSEDSPATAENPVLAE